MTLVEMRYDKQALAPYEAAYEAESGGCYGTVVDALHMILRLSKEASLGVRVSWRKHDAMKSVGASFSNLSIQDEVVSAVQELEPIERHSGADDAPEPLPTAAKSDPIPGTPNKRIASSIADDPAEDAPEPLFVLSPSRRVRGKTCAADVSMVFKRNRNYCQAEDCVFSRTMPGQPALCRDGNCAWCDPDAMASAIADGGAALRNVRISLSMFEEKNTACPPASL